MEFDIQWPPEGELVVRRVISRSRAIPTGKQWSVTLGRMTEWESNVECYGQQIIDVSPSVVTYCEQPFRLWYLCNGERTNHVPDLVAYLDSGRPWVIEFKSDDDPKLADAYDRSVLVEPMLRDAGFDYHVVLGSQLRRQAYLSNAKYLLRYGRTRASPSDFNFASHLLDATGDLSLGAFCKAYKSALDGLRAASRLVMAGHLALDMSVPITEKTVLSWRGASLPHGGQSWLQAAFAVTK